jgi:hypothetical protein
VYQNVNSNILQIVHERPFPAVVRVGHVYKSSYTTYISGFKATITHLLGEIILDDESMLAILRWHLLANHQELLPRHAQ